MSRAGNIIILPVARREVPAGVKLESQSIWCADRTNVVDLERVREDRAFEELRRDLMADSRETGDGR